MSNSVQYLYRKPGLTNERCDSGRISHSQFDLLNLRVKGNADHDDGKLREPHPNSGKQGAAQQQHHHTRTGTGPGELRRGLQQQQQQQQPSADDPNQPARLRTPASQLRSQQLRLEQSQRERTGHSTVCTVRSNGAAQQRKSSDPKDRGHQTDRRMVDRRMNFRFSEQKSTAHGDNLLGLTNSSFPFGVTPSGNLKIVPNQVVFSTQKVSILVDNPRKTKVNIEDENMDKMRLDSIMPAIPSKFFQKPQNVMTDSIEMLSTRMRSSDVCSDDKEMDEVGGDGPDCLKPEMRLERLSYSYAEPIDYTELNLPSKANLYHELYRRISNYIDTDVQIIIALEEFSCHSMVLQTYSDFFQKHAAVRRIELPQANVSSNAFVYIYDWMITDRECVKLLRRENALEIFVAAQYLEIKELEEQCWSFILSEAVFYEDTAFILYVAARKMKISSLKDLMVPRIRHFFLMLVSLQDFLDLAIDEVCVILGSSYIVVSCEMDVLMSAIRWLKYDWENRTKYLVRLMSCVRFGLIAPWQLVDIKRNRENPELMEIVNVPDVTRMVDDGLSFVIIKYWYCSNSRNDYIHWLELLNLDEPQERNWTGTEKNYETYQQFLVFLGAYRQKYMLDKNNNNSCGTAGEEIPPQPCYPPSDLLSHHGSAAAMAKEFFSGASSGASPCPKQRPPKEIYYPDTDDRSMPSPSSARTLTEEEAAASTIQSAYRGYRARRMTRTTPPHHHHHDDDEDEDARRKQEIYAQNMRVLSMFGTQRSVHNHKQKTHTTIVPASPPLPQQPPPRNNYLIDGSLYTNDRESILIFGGSDGKNGFGSTTRDISRDIYRYLPEPNTWEYAGELPEPRHYHSTAFFRGRVYLAGGANPLYSDVKEKTAIVNTVWSFDPVTRIWYREPSLITPRRNFGLVTVHMKLFAIGGQDRSGRMLASVERLDDTAWTEVAPMQNARMGMACTRYRESIWTAGGMCGTKRAPLTNVVECYNAKLDQWTHIPSLRYPRCFASLFPMNDKLYLIGGAGCSSDRDRETVSVSAMDVWDPDDQQWKLKTELSIPRHGHVIAYLGTQILVIGGVTTVYMRALSNIECYCVERNTWVRGINPLPFPMSSHTCVTLPPASLM